MGVDLAALKRKLKPDRRKRSFVVRSKTENLHVSHAGDVKEVFLDTNVYIHRAANRLPAQTLRFINRVIQVHCSVCLSEIVLGISKLHPGSDKFQDAWKYYTALFDSFPDGRIFAPEQDVYMKAGAVSGLLARTQNFGHDNRFNLYHDALILLTAAKRGAPVLTENREDFDLLQQALGEGKFVYYETPTA